MADRGYNPVSVDDLVPSKIPVASRVVTAHGAVSGLTLPGKHDIQPLAILKDEMTQTNWRKETKVLGTV